MPKLCDLLLWGACGVLFAALALAAARLPGGWGLRAALFWQQPAAALAAPAAETGAAAAQVAIPAATPAPDAAPAAGQAAPAAEETGDAVQETNPAAGDTGAAEATGETAPAAASLPAPDNIENPGTIVAQQLTHGSGTGYIPLAAGTIRNDTDLPDSELSAAAEQGRGKLPFDIQLNSSEPQVLILHTHATESYQLWDALYFDPDYTARSQNTLLNMCAVGAKMAEVLNAAGINTLHDTTLHDSPSYTESYGRSAATARAYLEKYPSIKVILDVHRDAIGDTQTRIKPLCQIDGEDTAQVMIIAGCDNGTTVQLPNWRLNLRFAAAWEAEMEALYPGLTRPVLCGYRYYNQDITTGSLLIEIGGHANTLPEALRAGEYAAAALAALLAG